MACFACADAILGALCLPDIGQQFPDTDPKWKGAASDVFVRESVSHCPQRSRPAPHQESSTAFAAALAVPTSYASSWCCPLTSSQSFAYVQKTQETISRARGLRPDALEANLKPSMLHVFHLHCVWVHAVLEMIQGIRSLLELTN